MRYRIEFSTDNAAFDEDPNEAERVLAKAGRLIAIHMGYGEGEVPWRVALTDINGNTVGQVECVEGT